MNEARFWRWLRERLPPGDYTRIESEVSPGLPDVSYATEKVHGWIELKAVPKAPHPFKRRGLRPSQRLWIARRVALHVPVALVGTIGSSFGIWNMSVVDPNRINGMTMDQLAKSATVWMLRRHVDIITVEDLCGEP